MALTVILSAILKNEVDHRDRGVLELLCKKNWIRRRKIGEAHPPPVFGQARIRTLTLTFEVKLTVTLY